ncbi:unnamed protein product [Phytophthora fragariaefolia]|uniref:Unnamed protein product n=1 Tax=Phytophthora fragariaefolia TaxID=1490495 RepID=A0A9W6Y898_9STRA|nr:unnamed protein product [Phytophthora fragariaefolia]
MLRRPRTPPLPVAPRSNPTTLDTYIQVAIDTSETKNRATPKKSKRRRKKQQQPSLAAVREPARLTSPPIPGKPERRKRKSKVQNNIVQSLQVSPQKCKFRVRGLVTVDELEDEDEAEEVQEEVRHDFARFGELYDAVIIHKKEEESWLLAGDVIVKFRDAGDALKAFTAIDGNVFGGKTVTCAWSGKMEGTAVVVQGLLIPEEVEDPDEVEDLKEEVMQMFVKHGVVKEMKLDEVSGDVTVIYSGPERGLGAVKALNGSRYGGRVVTAYLAQLSREAKVENHDEIERRLLEAEATSKVSYHVQVPIVLNWYVQTNLILIELWYVHLLLEANRVSRIAASRWQVFEATGRFAGNFKTALVMCSWVY